MSPTKPARTARVIGRQGVLYNLQALRALAAMLVIFPHLGTVLAPAGWTEDDMVFGQFGVDLFFVISGFVMVHTSSHKPLGPAMFMLNRFIRILPLYWLLTLIVFVGAMTTPGVFASTKADTTALIKSLMFVPFVKSNGLIRPVLHVGWTLNYEMFFYAIFAAALAISRRSITATVAITGCVLLLLVASRGLWPPGQIFSFFYTDPILVTFIYGMVLAWMHDHRPMSMSVGAAYTMLATGTVVLLVHRYVVPNGDYRVVFAGLPALAIVLSALILERNGHALRWRSVQLLGAASYSLYLSHPFLAQAVGLVSRKLASPAAAYLFAAFVLVAAPLAAIALYRFFEKPVTAFLRQQIEEPAPLIERNV